MKHTSKKLFLAILTMGLLSSSLIGCNGPINPGHDPKDDPIVPRDELLEAPSWATSREELFSHDDDVFYHNNSDQNTLTDYTFKLELFDANDSAMESIFMNYVHVYNSQRIEHELTFLAAGDGVYEVSPVVPYEAGRYYTIELTEDAPFHFYQKDPSMKEFHFDTKREGEDIEKYEVKSDVHRFNFNIIISKQDMSNIKEGEIRKMVCKTSLGLSKDDHFLFYDGVKIDRRSFYGKFDHEEYTSGAWSVYFYDPDLSAIFGEDGLQVNYQHYVPDHLEELVLASENEIKENLENDPDLSDFLYAAYLNYEPEQEHVLQSAQGWINAMKNIRIIPEFGFHWPGWSFSLTLRVTVPFKYLTITFIIQYYRKSTITVDASVELRTFAGIPYWADLALDISEEVDSSFRFCVAIGDTLPHADDPDTDFNHLSSYVVDQADKFENADNKFKTIKNNDEDGVKFDGKSLNVKLGTGRFPIGLLFDVFIDFTFVLKIEASLMISYTYTEHSVNHILSYRSGDDDKSSHSVTTLESSTKSLSLIGTIGVDAGLHVRFGIGVCGLEDYLNVSIYADIGVYLSIGGYGVWTWTDSPSGNTFEAMGGFIFEVGWYASIGVGLSIFFIDISVDFVRIRKPFYTTTNNDYFISAPNIEDNKIYLETNKERVKDLGILTITHFDSTFMTIGQETYDPEQEMDYLDDRGNNQHGKAFKFSFASGEHIKYDNGYLVVDDDAPCRFTDTLIIDVPKSLYKLKEGEEHFLVLEVEYYDYSARPVYFDDATEPFGYYRYGDTITLPEFSGDTPSGERFYGWYLNETDSYYAVGESFVIPRSQTKHAELRFTSDFYEIIYHTVNFYDGLGNLICTQVVEEGTDAIAPTDAERDANMPGGAIFIGWSIDFTNVYYDINVYAMYLFAEEGE